MCRHAWHMQIGQWKTSGKLDTSGWYPCGNRPHVTLVLVQGTCILENHFKINITSFIDVMIFSEMISQWRYNPKVKKKSLDNVHKICFIEAVCYAFQCHYITGRKVQREGCSAHILTHYFTTIIAGLSHQLLKCTCAKRECIHRKHAHAHEHTRKHTHTQKHAHTPHDNTKAATHTQKRTDTHAKTFEG